ncbi:uncharacterized protein LOC110382718 isoform X2 [Helicoverpa armigera]|uniref:uncharacterized protein LOC110382718 isoform X2 n=1 Tax=Helicoverpa armigera TaxID=29058 RepID=UPI0030833C9F
MMQVRTDSVRIMFYNIIFLFFILICNSIAFAEDVSTENIMQLPSDNETSKCGCDEMFVYDAVNDRCMVNFKKVLKKVMVPYAKTGSIYVEGENLFRGIMISVILFIACASACVLAACIYCCRINYSDWTLKHNVKALAKNLKTNYDPKKMSPKPAPLPAISESCSVVVEPAGVFVA